MESFILFIILLLLSGLMDLPSSRGTRMLKSTTKYTTATKLPPKPKNK